MEEGLVRRDPGPNIRTSEQPNLLVEHLNIWNRSLGGGAFLQGRRIKLSRPVDLLEKLLVEAAWGEK